jgi:RNA polymerase sigma factor (sigma-70 family)
MGENILNDVERVTEILPELRSFVSSKISNKDDVDDVVNEVCLALALNARQWRGDASFKTYVFAIATKKVYDFFRRKYRDQARMGQLQEQIKVEITCGRNKAFDVWVNNDLTHSEFAVFKLVGLGKSNDEIAAELFVSKDTLRSHLKHIYKKMGTSHREKVVALAHDFLKIHDNHKEWLEKFYNTYVQLGEKGGHITKEMKEDASRAKDNLMKRLER